MVGPELDPPGAASVPGTPPALMSGMPAPPADWYSLVMMMFTTKSKRRGKI